jgi:hypothetical protein
VRDALAEAERPLDGSSLASYVRSIVAGARRSGRYIPAIGEAPTRPSEWLASDWHMLRLVAVCLLAEAEDLL